jgi:hypothetical protein
MTTNIVAVKKKISISTGTCQEGFRANQAEIGLKLDQKLCPVRNV